MKALIKKKPKSSERHEYTAEFFQKTFLKDIKHSIVRAIDCPFLIRSFSSHKDRLLFHVAK